MSSPPNRTLIIVEDDDELRRFLDRLLCQSFVVHSFASGATALDALRDLAPAVLVSDLDLPCVSGEALARAAAELPQRPLVVLMSGSAERLGRARQLAAVALLKPFAPRDLMAALTALPT